MTAETASVDIVTKEWLKSGLGEKTMVITRNVEQPIEVVQNPTGICLPDDILSYDPLENLRRPEDIPQTLGPNDYDDVTLGHDLRTKLDSDDSDSELDPNDFSAGQLSTAEFDDDEFVFPEEDRNAMAAFDMSQLDTITPDPLTQPHTASPATHSTRTFEDSWHVKNRLLKLLPHGHSAFKPFAAALRMSMYVYDRNDRARVEEVLKAKGDTWAHALRTRTAKIRIFNCVHT
ncbi:hypothetical protein B0H14DRAFT_3520131 [Mycena olivaceomarginata]|nr:hypothetical protein B0H14DRAFT_3520131 [Mycena olivaceomarginata]